MADQGPMVRVDTDGRGTLLKLSKAEATSYIASHPGAKLVEKAVAAPEDVALLEEAPVIPQTVFGAAKSAGKTKGA